MSLPTLEFLDNDNDDGAAFPFEFELRLRSRSLNDINHQSWHDDGIGAVKCRMGEKCNCCNVIQMMNVVS